jgi:CBS domain-containing protein
MTTVRQILEAKGYEVETIGPEASVFDALQRMSAREVGALVVLEDDRICGLVSERDYARKVILLGRSSRETQIADIMTRNVQTVGLDQKVSECMVLMTEGRFRHLPTVEEDRLVGIISIGDVVKAIMEEQQLTIEQLETYITGRG